MEMHGDYQISANRETVWDALNEPAVLKACLEGCESFDKVSDSAFEAKVTTKVGPIKMTFSCSIELSDIDPPNAYTISVQGNGGAAGYANVSAKVLLIENEGITVLSYTVDASLKGKIGQMGSRVVDSVARRMADDFFNEFTVIVNERSGVVTEPPPATKVATKKLRYYLFRALVIAVVVGLIIFGFVFLTAMH